MWISTIVMTAGMTVNRELAACGEFGHDYQKLDNRSAMDHMSLPGLTLSTKQERQSCSIAFCIRLISKPNIGMKKDFFPSSTCQHYS